MDVPFNPKTQKSLRQQLRNTCSEPERRLWRFLRNSQMGVKFRRQAGFGNYVVDFYCPCRKLVVELDGDSHAGADASWRDEERTAFLQQAGIRVVRFANRDVLMNIEGVLQALAWELRESALRV